MAPYFGLLLLTIMAPLHGFSLITSNPPNPTQKALMGRYVVHNTDWASISTISTIKQIQSYPFVNIKSMSDGPVSNGTGIPYLYMSPMDLTSIDVEKDNRCTLLTSLAETDYCTSSNFDPQDPRCARVMLTGHFVKVDETTDEYAFAKDALFARHPSMKQWPVGHSWYIAKIDIEMVIVLDFFGGVSVVSVEDYLAANLNSINSLVFDSYEVEVIEVIG